MEASGLSRISIRRITVGLVVMSGLFVVLGIVTQALSPGPAEPYTWTHLFDLDAEASAAGVVPDHHACSAAHCCCMVDRLGSRGGAHRTFMEAARRRVCVYLSADENATIHETVGFWISHRFGRAGRLRLADPRHRVRDRDGARVVEVPAPAARRRSGGSW